MNLLIESLLALMLFFCVGVAIGWMIWGSQKS